MSETVGEDKLRALLKEGWEHLKLQRPLAAWASWQQALRLKPDDPAATEALQRLAASAVLPESARRVHRFASPADAAERQRWDVALRGRDLQAIGDAEAAFNALLTDHPEALAARLNRALCLAWQGKNRAAIDELSLYIDQIAPQNFEAAVDAGCLSEVLRHGAGVEDLADDLSHTGSAPWPALQGDPMTLAPEGCARAVPFSRPGLPSDDPSDSHPPFEWLDRPMAGADAIVTIDDVPRVLVSAIAQSGVLRFATPDRRGRDLFLSRFAGALEAAAGGAIQLERHVLPLNLLDAAVFTFRFPEQMPPERRQELSHQGIADYYENRWIHEPRLSLATPGRVPLEPLTPLEAAAGTPAERARVEAALRLREQLSRRPGHAPLYASYPFDRLRRRLNLPMMDPGTVAADAYAAMNRDELAALDPIALTDQERQAARLSAEGLNDAVLAARFQPSPTEPRS